MNSTFEEATALVPAHDDAEKKSFRGVIPDGWQQGKGAFGGVVVGLLARAIVASESDGERRLRSLSADLAAPALPGPVLVEVSHLRRGGRMSFIEARLVQDGALIARASASLASPRAVPPMVVRNPTPVMPPWRDVTIVPVEPPIGPVFARKYEFRSTGPLPFVASDAPVAEGWVREKVTPSILDEAAIAGLLDVWWPTCFAVEATPRGVATVGYTMQLLASPRELSPLEPLFYRARGVATHDNYFVEMRELWSGDRVVAMNQQTFALLT